jgi:hypothetical protein
MALLDGYPSSFGFSMLSVFSHPGPASYTQVTVTPGTVPAVGGDVVQAIEAGLKYFDQVLFAMSDDAMWRVEPFPLIATARIGSPGKTYGLKWIALKTAAFGGQAQTAGQEAVAATNLSTVTVRLTALGPKA